MPDFRIFLNYRREDAPGHTGRLYDALVARFGAGSVFMDVDTLEPGEDFTEVLAGAVTSCDALIALIGREWSTTTTADGERRLDNPEDFVRIEIEAALERNIRVIPALVEGARMPQTKELPGSLAALATRHAVELSDERWRYDVGRLIATLERLAAGHGALDAAATDSPAASSAAVPSDSDGLPRKKARLAARRRRRPSRRAVFVAGACLAAVASAAVVVQLVLSPAHSLSGRVVDLRSGQPLAGILVATQKKSARTGGDGSFHLKGVGKGGLIRFSGCGHAAQVLRASTSAVSTVSLQPLPALGVVTSDFNGGVVSSGLSWRSGGSTSLPITSDPNRGGVIAYGACPRTWIVLTAAGYAPTRAWVDATRHFRAALRYTRVADAARLRLITPGDYTASRGLYIGNTFTIVAKKLRISNTFDVRSEPLSDTQLDATVALESGNVDDGIVLVCRHNPQGEYDFYISNDGYAKIMRYNSPTKKWTTLREWKASPAISPGAGVPNRMSASCVGSHNVVLSLLVNGIPTARAIDHEGLGSGRVGVSLTGYKRPLQRVGIKDVSIRRL